MSRQGIFGRARTAMLMVWHAGFPWAPAPGAPLRRAARRSLLRRYPPGTRLLAAAGMILAWPVSSLIESFRVAHYALPGAMAGRSRAGLALAAWRHALRRNFSPTEYVAYRLFEAPARGSGDWLTDTESGHLCRMSCDAEAVRMARDKLAFAGFCAGLGIAVVPTLAWFSQGAAVQDFEGGQPPAHDLVAKPRHGSGATGIAGWRHEAGKFRRMTDRTGYAESRGPALAADAFSAMLAARSAEEGDLLVQPWLRPHPVLAGLCDPEAGQGMPALRVITGRWPSGAVEILAGLVQRPAPGSFASQAGPYGLLDRDTGRVLAATRAQRAPVFELARADPALEGLAIPDWEALRAAVLGAHGAFPGRAALIGWDVAPTAERPVLLEANTSLSFYLFQMASGRPALDGRLRALLEAWL